MVLETLPNRGLKNGNAAIAGWPFPAMRSGSDYRGRHVGNVAKHGKHIIVLLEI
jgi:hypothetical protein